MNFALLLDVVPICYAKIKIIINQVKSILQCIRNFKANIFSIHKQAYRILESRVIENIVYSLALGEASSFCGVCVGIFSSFVSPPFATLQTFFRSICQ